MLVLKGHVFNLWHSRVCTVALASKAAWYGLAQPGPAM